MKQRQSEAERKREREGKIIINREILSMFPRIIEGREREISLNFRT